MRGHLRRRRPGVWEALFYLGKDAGGIKRYRSVTIEAATKSDAETELAKLLVAISAEGPASASTPLPAYLEKWLSHHGPQVADTSRERYAWAIHPLSREFAGVTLRRLTTARLQEGITNLSSAYAPRSVRLCAAVLRAALKTAEEWGVLPRSPWRSIKLPQIRRKPMEIPEPETLFELLEALRPTLHVPAALAYLAGLRRGEALALRWQDVDLRAGELRVTRNRVRVGKKQEMREPKTKGSERAVALPATLSTILQEEMNRQRTEAGDEWQPSDPVCQYLGAPWNLTTFTFAWRRNAPGLDYHALRHAHAAHLLDAGADVKTLSERLGHGSVAFTLQTYGGRVKASRHHQAAEAFETFTRSQIGRRLGTKEQTEDKPPKLQMIRGTRR